VFISLEGVDGSGKSTQARLLADALSAEGRDVVAVREPGGTAAGERIRELLLDPAATISPWAEALLYAAARAELVHEVIRPALARRAVVVADRFVDSSLAYQGVARGLGIDEVLEANDLGTGGLLPDRTVVIDVPEELAARRRRHDPDRIEAAGADFQRAVARGFEAVARRFPERVVVVSGDGSKADVAARVRAAVDA
jgi:dTMP kinase